MRNILDMRGALTVRKSHVATEPAVELLAKALRLETVDHVLVNSDRIDFTIDQRVMLRPDGVSWLFGWWNSGYLAIDERVETITIEFQMRVTSFAIMIWAGMALTSVLIWRFGDPRANVIFAGFCVIVAISLIWDRYITFPRWVRRVLTDPHPYAPKPLKTTDIG